MLSFTSISLVVSNLIVEKSGLQITRRKRQTKIQNDNLPGGSRYILNFFRKIKELFGLSKEKYYNVYKPRGM